MTHRVHPYIFRIGTIRSWKSRWFNRSAYQKLLREDTLLREWLEKRLRHCFVDVIEFERSPAVLQVIVKTSRPGMIIGRGGEGVEKLKGAVQQKIANIYRQFRESAPERQELKLTIEEVRKPETRAAIVAQMIIDDIERRMPFRRVMRQAVQKVEASPDVQGVKLSLKGRLDGSEMARHETLKRGRIPLQTLRANIDYAGKTAYTTYGTIGVKVWIYTGDVFEKKEK